MSEIHLERYEKIGLPLSGVVVVALLFILYLNGNTETPQVPHLVCVTPLVRTARFEEKPFYSEWTLLQAHVHQRHMDRWMYEHSPINNKCWPKQINSSHSLMASQCKYNVSSVWDEFVKTADPYAEPGVGNCSASQLTRQGVSHSVSFGKLLRKQYTEHHPLITPECPTGSIGLEAESAQKNQLTLQYEYFGLCGRFPNPQEFPEREVFENGRIQKGRPFWLQTKICNNTRFWDMLSEATGDMYASDYWNEGAKDITEKLAEITGHDIPEPEDRAAFIDSVIDCLVVHQCHNLTDIPENFFLEEDTFRQIDTLETKFRLYPFDYFSLQGSEVHDLEKATFHEFSSYYYGYYFKVLHDRMTKRIANDASVKNLYLQVTSDAIISPQLRILGIGTFGNQRPPWGSSLVYELYKHNEQPDQYAVRILFNSHPAKICGNKGYCTWEEWTKEITPFFPAQGECKPFYNHYE